MQPSQLVTSFNLCLNIKQLDGALVNSFFIKYMILMFDKHVCRYSYKANLGTLNKIPVQTHLLKHYLYIIITMKSLKQILVYNSKQLKNHDRPPAAVAKEVCASVLPIIPNWNGFTPIRARSASPSCSAERAYS